jgi:hypothetical protein
MITSLTMWSGGTGASAATGPTGGGFWPFQRGFVAVNSPQKFTADDNVIYALLFSDGDFENNGGTIYRKSNAVGATFTFHASINDGLGWDEVGQDIAVNSSTGDLYVMASNKIFRQAGGTGNWHEMGATSPPASLFKGIAVNSSTDDIWLTAGIGSSAGKYGVLKLSGGTGSYQYVSTGVDNWNAIAINTVSGDVYASIGTNTIAGSIVKFPGGTGPTESLASSVWYTTRLSVDSTNNNVYASSPFDTTGATNAGQLWVQTGGTGSFQEIKWPMDAYGTAGDTRVTNVTVDSDKNLWATAGLSGSIALSVKQPTP